MSDTFDSMSDRELLRIVTGTPGSVEGRAAREELEFRKHLAVKQQNRWLVWLTLILAVGSLGQVVVGLTGLLL